MSLLLDALKQAEENKKKSSNQELSLKGQLIIYQ